ncbi:MAG: S8 family peptidase [Candidatus Thorarchaeota archaeon]
MRTRIFGIVFTTLLFTSSIGFAFMWPWDPGWKIGKDLMERMEAIDENANTPVIVVFDDKARPELVEKYGYLKRELRTVKGASGWMSPRKIRQLVKENHVKGVYLNKKVWALLDDSIPMIEADKVWEDGVTGKGVKVCIVDTGVGPHSDLKPLTAQWDFVNNDNDATDDHGHGTHVAGIVASQDATYKGVAPDASLMAAKVLDASGSGSYDDVIAGIEWCHDNGADVVSISLGGQAYKSNCDSNILAQTVNQVVSDGVVVSVAAGNDGTDGLTTPACASGAIAVGAVDKNGNVPWWSSRGEEMDIAAPGVDITSLYLNNGLTTMSGTSMACPHVSGVSALLLSAKPTLTVDEVKTALYTTATAVNKCYQCDFSWNGNCFLQRQVSCTSSITGAGIVNAWRAYQSITLPTTTTSTTSTTTSILTTSTSSTTSISTSTSISTTSSVATTTSSVTTSTTTTETTSTSSSTISSTSSVTTTTSTTTSEETTSITTTESSTTSVPTTSSTTTVPTTETTTSTELTTTVTPTVKCWDGSNQLLYRNRKQMRKFCKCAQGTYDYSSYSYSWGRRTVYYYVDSGDNEKWETKTRYSYLPVHRVKCVDGNYYPTNQDYYYG